MTSKLSVGRGTFLGLVLTEVFGELGEETCAIIDLLLEEFEGSRAPIGSASIIVVIAVIVLFIILSSVLARSLSSARTFGSV